MRNYEAAGVLPPAERTTRGYRVFTPLHAGKALRVFPGLVLVNVVREPAPARTA